MTLKSGLFTFYSRSLNDTEPWALARWFIWLRILCFFALSLACRCACQGALERKMEASMIRRLECERYPRSTNEHANGMKLFRLWTLKNWSLFFRVPYPKRTNTMIIGALSVCYRTFRNTFFLKSYLINFRQHESFFC